MTIDPDLFHTPKRFIARLILAEALAKRGKSPLDRPAFVARARVTPQSAGVGTGGQSESIKK